MSALHKLFKNWMLPLSAVVLLLGVAGVVLGAHLLAYVSPGADAVATRPLQGGWDLWVLILGVFALLTGGWYFGDQLLRRRKFRKLLATDKRTEFLDSRKKLEDLARALPDSYKPRIAEKDAAFKSARR